MHRQRVSTGTAWESVVGYSRAVRVGPTIHVAGTTSVDSTGAVVGPGDPYIQAVHVLQKIELALRELGATLDDVVRTRMFVTDMRHWEAVGRAHGEAFALVRPAATMVQVAALIDPALLVEIEADAIVGETG